METGKQDGQIMMQDAMIQLHKEDQISGKTLMQHIKDPNRLKDYLIKMREKQAFEARWREKPERTKKLNFPYYNRCLRKCVD